MSKFEVGDKATVKTGHGSAWFAAGDAVTITHETGDSGHSMVKVNGSSRWWDGNRFEKVDGPFKVGARVVYRGFPGATPFPGTVVLPGKTQTQVRYDHGTGSDAITYSPNSSLTAEAVKGPKFTIGERVLILTTAPRHKSKFGRVTEVVGTSNPYYIVDVEGHGLDRGGLWERFLKRAISQSTPTGVKAATVAAAKPFAPKARPGLSDDIKAARVRLGKLEKMERLAKELGYTLTKSA